MRKNETVLLFLRYCYGAYLLCVWGLCIGIEIVLSIYWIIMSAILILSDSHTHLEHLPLKIHYPKEVPIREKKTSNILNF